MSAWVMEITCVAVMPMPNAAADAAVDTKFASRVVPRTLSCLQYHRTVFLSSWSPLALVASTSKDRYCSKSLTPCGVPRDRTDSTKNRLIPRSHRCVKWMLQCHVI